MSDINPVKKEYLMWVVIIALTFLLGGIGVAIFVSFPIGAVLILVSLVFFVIIVSVIKDPKTRIV